MFDHVFLLANGQCVYQGEGANIVSYTQSIGLNCPVTYNPADFSTLKWNFFHFFSFHFTKLNQKNNCLITVIDVASGEYGYEYVDKMISQIDNGRCYNWTPNYALEHLKNPKLSDIPDVPVEEFEEYINPKHLRARSTNWQQFCTLYKRRTTQMWRDSVSA